MAYSTFIQSVSASISLTHIHVHTHTSMAASNHARCWYNHREQFGVRYLTQGHFDMQTGEGSNHILISGQHTTTIERTAIKPCTFMIPRG